MLWFSAHGLGTAYRMSTFRKLKRRKILSRPAAGPFLPMATLLDGLVRRTHAAVQWPQMTRSVLVMALASDLSWWVGSSEGANHL